MAESATGQLKYEGRTGEIFRIWIVNLLLKIVTLGIYTFWGKTRMRKYILGSFTFLDDRFEYTGTGMELFMGFIKALPVIVALYIPFIIWPADQYPVVMLMLIPLFFLLYAGIYAGFRYKLSRTTWRGVRGKLTGSAFAYAGKMLGLTILSFISLGMLWPYLQIRGQERLLNHVHIGSMKVDFRGKAKKLFGIHVLTLILFIPTLGFSRMWYAAALFKHIYANTTLNGLRFKGTFSGGKFLVLELVNLLIIIFTLTLGMPIVIQRNMKFFVEHLEIEGELDTAQIQQSDQKLGKSGEGLEGAFGEADMGFM